jgi:cell division protein FtsB
MITADPSLAYVVVAVSSFTLGLILSRVIGRKTISAVEARNRDLEAQLTHLKQVPASSPAPPQKARFTGGEVASVITALAALVAAAGGFYINTQKDTVEDLNGKIEVFKRERDELAAEVKSLGRLLGFKTNEWEVVQADDTEMPTKGTEVVLDGTRQAGSCNIKKVSWLYKGTDPAILECKPGEFLLKGNLRSGAVLLIRRAEASRRQ